MKNKNSRNRFARAGRSTAQLDGSEGQGRQNRGIDLAGRKAELVQKIKELTRCLLERERQWKQLQLADL